MESAYEHPAFMGNRVTNAARSKRFIASLSAFFVALRLSACVLFPHLSVIRRQGMQRFGRTQTPSSSELGGGGLLGADGWCAYVLPHSAHGPARWGSHGCSRATARSYSRTRLLAVGYISLLHRLTKWGSLRSLLQHCYYPLLYRCFFRPGAWFCSRRRCAQAR